MNFQQLIKTCEKAHSYLQDQAVSAINQPLTIRNWLLGYYIVEYEQNGDDRAKYGDQLLTVIAKGLKSKGIKGLSKRNLHYFLSVLLHVPRIGPTCYKYEYTKTNCADTVLIIALTIHIFSVHSRLLYYLNPEVNIV